jgi:hypothetical protein
MKTKNKLSIKGRINSVIILISLTSNQVKVFANFHRACAELGWNYRYLVYQDMPFEFEGWECHKLRIE